MANLLLEDTSKIGRPITVVVFALLLGFLVLASTVIPVPRRDSVDRSLDLIMLEAIEAAVAKEVEETTEPLIEEEFSEPEVTQVDVDELLSSFTDLSSFKVVEEEASLQDRGEMQSMALESDVGLDFGGQEDLGVFGNSQIDGLDTDLTSQKKANTWTLRPNIVSGSAIGSSAQLGAGSGVAEAELAIRSDQPERLIESIFDEWEEEGISMTADEIIRENAVIRWMREYQNALDRPVRTVFQQNSTDLTVNMPVPIGSQTYHLQMMYSPISRTLHIAWIDGDDIIYYFVDPALQYQINYFEEGVVERGPAMQVVLLETEELSAQSPQALREYQVFINWWKPQIESMQDG